MGLVADRRSTVDGRRSTVGGRRSAVAGRRSAVAGRRSMVAGRRSPVSGRRSTVGCRRSPGKNCVSSIVYDKRPVPTWQWFLVGISALLQAQQRKYWEANFGSTNKPSIIQRPRSQLAQATLTETLATNQIEISLHGRDGRQPQISAVAVRPNAQLTVTIRTQP